MKKRKSVIPIGVSIGKNFDTPNNLAVNDYLYCLDKVFELADYIAINISSPNTEGLRSFEVKQELVSLIKPLKERQLELTKQYGYKPLILKISPDNDKEGEFLTCSIPNSDSNFSSSFFFSSSLFDDFSRTAKMFSSTFSPLKTEDSWGK